MSTHFIPSLLILSLAVFSITREPAAAEADVVAYSCTGPTSGPVRAIVERNACVGYRVQTKGGGARTVKFPFKGSGKLIASVDGRTVVMLHSNLYGRRNSAGDIVGYEGRSKIENPIAVHIYRDGKPVSSHRIHELVKRKHLVRQSVSHVRWVRSAPSAIRGKSFSIETLSFRTITFDATTGKILEQGDADAWTGCDVIASGQVELGKEQLSKARFLKTGERHPTVRFRRERGVRLSDKAYTTVCLERRDGEYVLTETL